MKELLHRIFLVNWPRKCVALLSAFVIWFLVNQSVTITKTFSNIPVQVLNLPPQKTVIGLSPKGILNKKISVTLTGSKRSLEELESSEISVMINAEGKEEGFITKIDKKNLSFTDDRIKDNITDVSSNDLFIKVTNLVTDEIPVTIHSPIGEPPFGFQFLDVSPRKLMQKVSGPQEEIEELKKKGLEVTFNFDKITPEELEAIKSMYSSSKSDEVSFFIPISWKKVAIPFQDYIEEPLNDPRAQYLRIDFLKQELLPLNARVPVTLFYPVQYSSQINPNTYHLQLNPLLEEKNGLILLDIPLYVQGVSRHFLDIVKNNITLTAVLTPKDVQPTLNWSILFVDEKNLEEKFVSSLSKEKGESTKYNEEVLKHRFRLYLTAFKLYTEQEVPLRLTFFLGQNEVLIKE